MRVLVWITEPGWEAAVDAAAPLGADEIVLLCVTGAASEAPGGALSGLLGRRREPAEARLAELDAAAAERLLDAAAQRLGRPVRRTVASGRAEHAVVEAARDVDVLVLSRATLDPGPRSLGHGARFVVDHARSRVLLVWPGPAPAERPPPPPKHPPR
jgi:hypothetical protein